MGPLLSTEDESLEALAWIINPAVTGRLPQLADTLARGEDVSMDQRFAVRPPSEDVLPEDRVRWHELTGEELGEDVYMVGTTFTREVVLPRKTLQEILQALEKKRAEFPEPPFPWLFRLDPYYLCPAEGERELVRELEERAVAFSCMQHASRQVDEALLKATRKELLRDLEAAGVFSEAYSKQKQEWLQRWSAAKLLTYHRDAMRFLNHFRSQVQPPVAQQLVPALRQA
jgi:hypothetical protein